eukprot:CAMPEP_0202692742 /NCGR_PEP_ID=MMETSP1385-20130828/7050_1 /ASSEMBLY_ACC=CAM_ASM_000861 /TAXON_ID=933848 /ORGANISM="Elphidium margaritaceum" /LENGTH=274 /DNA_ID=CAMNT_0049348329 /DNA_START=22 /DNA_END=846 /DNA_ORIENTATION=+
MSFWAAASATSLVVRGMEWYHDYDGKVKRYLEAETAAEKEKLWEAILNDIELHPDAHSWRLMLKSCSDLSLLGTAAYTAWPFVKAAARSVANAIKNCWNKFLDLLRQMHNAAKDFFISKDSISAKMAKIRQSIADRLYDSFVKFKKLLIDTMNLIQQNCIDLWNWIRDTLNIRIKTITVDNVTELQVWRGDNLVWRMSVTARSVGPLFTTTSAAAYKVFRVVGSFAAQLALWVGSQLGVEFMKYYCSCVGLYRYYLDQTDIRIDRKLLLPPIPQ